MDEEVMLETEQVAFHPGHLVPGIEMSCVAGGISVHLLGYLHDPCHPPLIAELQAARASRDDRARRIVDLLSETVPLTWSDVLEQVSGDATIGRPHIADALVARGVVADRNEAFGRYLYTGSPYYARHYAVDVARGVRLIREAGGVPVMAHPFAANRGRVVADVVIEQMAAAGLAGLEAHHVDHSSEHVAHAVDLAAALGLLVTGGSDYHGDGKPNRLGDRTTDPAVFDQIAAAATGTELVRP